MTPGSEEQGIQRSFDQRVGELKSVLEERVNFGQEEGLKNVIVGQLEKALSGQPPSGDSISLGTPVDFSPGDEDLAKEIFYKLSAHVVSSGKLGETKYPVSTQSLKTIWRANQSLFTARNGGGRELDADTNIEGVKIRLDGHAIDKVDDPNDSRVQFGLVFVVKT